MNNRTSEKTLLQRTIDISVEVGRAILKVYHSSIDIAVTTKADDSPLTIADLAAHRVLVSALGNLLSVPVLSEEETPPPFSERSQWQRYWLVDPLDGTKEFVQRSGEFTVNIALIEDGVPVLGVVHVPVLGITYAGSQNSGAIKLNTAGQTSIQVRKVQPRITAGEAVEMVASRSHGKGAVEGLITQIEPKLGSIALKNMGSSLKLCLVAEGAADLYPRLAPTCEWDTAAAQAVVEAAGGIVVDEHFELLRYNRKASLLNPYFYVIGDQQFNWRQLLSK